MLFLFPGIRTSLLSLSVRRIADIKSKPNQMEIFILYICVKFLSNLRRKFRDVRNHKLVDKCDLEIRLFRHKNSFIRLLFQYSVILISVRGNNFVVHLKYLNRL